MICNHCSHPMMNAIQKHKMNPAEASASTLLTGAFSPFFVFLIRIYVLKGNQLSGFLKHKGRDFTLSLGTRS